MGKCDGAGECVDCLVDDDCMPGEICKMKMCVPATCSDGQEDGNETDIDCGGLWNGCPDNGACLVDADCQSKICNANVCQVPTCTDGVKNGGETDMDCGGPSCPRCATGDGCSVNSDCIGTLCSGSTCL